MSLFDLADKAALITGASRGLGRAMALGFARAGADVVLSSRKAEACETVADEIRALGRRAAVCACNVSHWDEVSGLAERAWAAFGRLDILVNSAGIWRAAPIEQMSLADFDETMEVNLRAPFVASKAAAAHMGEGGRIISIGSNLAERVTDTSLSAYSTSKAALVGLTKALARDLGSRGITANVVHPGSTDTDMNPAEGPHAEHQRQKMATPRFGKADEIAGMVAWLAGPEGRFVTGAALTIDGGANA